MTPGSPSPSRPSRPSREGSAWAPPPARPSLDAGRVDVWRATLTPEPARLAELESHLGSDELARAARFRAATHRDRFVAARGQLREVLGWTLGVSPAAVAFRYGAYGKPEVEPASPLRFNLTHAGDLALVAVTRDRRVGVDIEPLREVPDADAIVEHFFSAREIGAYRALADAVRPVAFLTCWTRKEAFVKAVGEGLSYPLDAFDVTVGPHEAAALLEVRGGDADRWALHEIPAGPGHLATLAVEAAPAEAPSTALAFWEVPGRAADWPPPAPRPS